MKGSSSKSVPAVIGAVLVATFAASAPSAWAAPKAGDRCAPKQVGTSSGPLTCVKEGSLRRWRPSPSTKPSAVTSAPAAPAPASSVATSSAGATATSGATKEPIKIGVALGQTGASTASLAQDQTLATRLAERFFNDRGGVNGRPIKLVFQDTGPDAPGAINAFNTLIDSDKVVGIVGPTLSAQAFAADPIAEKAKVPVVAPSNTAAGVPQIGDYIQRVSAGVAAYAGNTVKYARTLQLMSKAAVFYAQDDAFSRSETVVFQDAIKAGNITLLPPQTFLVNDTDFTQQTQYVQRERPDLVAISGLATSGNLVKQLRDSGYNGVIIGGNGLNVVQTFAVCKQQCEGIIVAQAYSPDIPRTGMNADFKAAFVADQKREPGQLAAQAFTSVQVFVEALTALDKAGKLTSDLGATRRALNDTILSGKYSTPLGDISFDKDGDVNQKNFYVAQIHMLRGDTSDVFSGKFSYVSF